MYCSEFDGKQILIEYKCCLLCLSVSTAVITQHLQYIL